MYGYALVVNYRLKKGLPVIQREGNLESQKGQRNAVERSYRERISRKAVQYYEDQGFVKPVKLENGYRDYDEDCLKTLRDIHAMRQMGLHIKEIRAILIEEEYAPQVYEQLNLISLILR